MKNNFPEKHFWSERAWRLPASRNGSRGSALVAALIIILLVAASMSQLSVAIGGNARIQDRKRDAVRARLAAEAGIALALDFFARPERYDDAVFGTNPFVHAPDDAGDYSPMEALLAGEDLVIPEEFFPAMDFETNGENHVAAELVEIRLTAPPAGAPAETLAMIRSVAVSRRYGVQRTVEALIRPPRSFNVAAPAAIMSYKNIVTNGNVQVHWGEMWAKGSISMEHPNKYNTATGPTQAIRAEGNLTFASAAGVWKIPAAVQSSPTIEIVAPHSTSSSIRNSFDNRLFQNQTLDFPEYDYQTLKDIAQQFGHYYSTDDAGKIYLGGVEDPAHEVAFNAIIDNSLSDPARFVFIDTIDGNPPAVDNSNLVEIGVSGGASSKYMHGMYYIAAHLDITGVGASGQNITVDIPEEPDDWSSTQSWPSGQDTIQVISNGIVVVAGNLRCAGQPEFYGSLAALGEIVGGGTPNVYYNPDLVDGLDFPLLSRVEAFQWRMDGAPSYEED
jgi:hypothetical protein